MSHYTQAERHLISEAIGDLLKKIPNGDVAYVLSIGSFDQNDHVFEIQTNVPQENLDVLLRKLASTMTSSSEYEEGVAISEYEEGVAMAMKEFDRYMDEIQEYILITALAVATRDLSLLPLAIQKMKQVITPRQALKVE